HDRRALLLIKSCTVGLLLLLVAILSVCEGAQCLVPLGLQRIGNESVVRVALHEAAAREIRLVARPLDFLLAQPVTLFRATLDLLLDGQSDFERDRCDRLNEQCTDGLVQRGAMNFLALRLTVLDTATLTNIV